MSETSVYYVPVDQDAWCGRSDDLAERLWNHGVFLDTPVIMDRLDKFSEENRPLPECTLDIEHTFGEIGIADELLEEPVPNNLYGISCPKCGYDMMDLAYDAWSDESNIAPKERIVTCPDCNLSSTTEDLQYEERMEFARFYVFVSDCIQDDWNSNFFKLLEEILGPCREYWEHST